MKVACQLLFHLVIPIQDFWASWPRLQDLMLAASIVNRLIFHVIVPFGRLLRSPENHPNLSLPSRQQTHPLLSLSNNPLLQSSEVALATTRRNPFNLPTPLLQLHMDSKNMLFRDPAPDRLRMAMEVSGSLPGHTIPFSKVLPLRWHKALPMEHPTQSGSLSERNHPKKPLSESKISRSTTQMVVQNVKPAA